MKVGEMAFALVSDFLVELMKKFRGGNNELAKVEESGIESKNYKGVYLRI